KTDIERLTKSLAREAAFSFAADISLLFITNPLQNTLELTGTYGCNPDQIPSTISPREGLVGQVMSTGGYLSVEDLRKQTDHKVRYLEKSGIVSLHACCLEIQGKILGTILIGFRRKRDYCQQEMVRFEELCRGAAVAIANNLAQAQLKSYTERLEELVEQRTSELEIQSAKAQQANDAKSHFLANMTHELRTPITAILGYSSIMSDGVLGDITPQQAEGLSAIIRSSEHLKSLIDDVLNLARIEAGKEEVSIGPLSLRNQITHVQHLMKQSATEKGIHFPEAKLSEEAATLEFLCDRKHFQQILMNLLSNAIKYTPAEGSVWIESRQQEDKVEISVCDTGVGLSDTEKSEIFERFSRTGNPYSQQQVGTGLGLALTKNLVELNRGKIRAEDNPGGGSRFILTYPIATEQSSEIAGVLSELHESQSMTKLDGLSILVVDDNEDTRDILQTILIAAGATVQVTSSVPDARASLKHFQPDVLLTEMAMRGESGIDLIHFVRNGTSGLDHIPIVVVSACAFDSDQLTALSAGANIFYPKPFRPSEVLQGIRELTLHHAMMDE
ncbi:MAG: ATP-binding protein, partial [Bdellovibrionota bacterium]